MHFYHIVDYGTSYQVACASPGQSSIEKIISGWSQWAGPPTMLVADAGIEFTSKEFSSFLTQFNVRPHIAPR